MTQTKNPSTIKEVGQRIIVDGVPYYVGQTVNHDGRTGTVDSIIVSKNSKEAKVNCKFRGRTKQVAISELMLPVATMETLERRADDFFDALNVGDAIDGDIFEVLGSMAQPLVIRDGYFQVCGAIGFTQEEAYEEIKTKKVATYLTVKKFPGDSSQWRYIGYCKYGDDVHIPYCVANAS